MARTSTGTDIREPAQALRLGFRLSVVAYSLAVSLVFLLGGGWLAAGNMLDADGDFDHGFFWFVMACLGLFFLGVWLANGMARIHAGGALTVGDEGLRLYPLGKAVVGWREIENIVVWQEAASASHTFVNLFKIGSAHPHLYLTMRLEAAAFNRLTDRIHLVDQLVFALSLRINRPERKVLFACWPLQGTTQALVYSLERLAARHGVAMHFPGPITNVVRDMGAGR